MSLIAKDKGGSDFEPVAAGMHAAVCYGIIDIGTQPGFGNFPPKRKVIFLWEIPGERIDVTRGADKVNLPRGISSTFTLSLSPKSRMRPMLESWRGRTFTAEELNGFDLKAVLGANCLLNVIHVQGTGKNVGKVFGNVAAVSPLAKGMPRLKSENKPIFFSLDECGETITVPQEVPDWIKAKILGCEEALQEQRRNGSQPEPTEAEQANLDPAANEEDVPF